MTEPFTVLIVDDDYLNRDMLEATFKVNGFKVLTASRGAQGLAMIQEKMPDLVLLDIRMPDMDGYDVCAAIKGDSTTAHIKVVMITGLKDTRTERETAKAAGADDFVIRMMGSQNLARYIKSLLQPDD